MPSSDFTHDFGDQGKAYLFRIMLMDRLLGKLLDG